LQKQILRFWISKGTALASPRETAIRSEIARLKAAYPWQLGRSQAFWEALSDLWPEDVEAGVLTTLREWAGQGCPSPGYVRERALAHRSGRDAPPTKPKRGPVPWHEARLPMRDRGDGYLRDADGRYVMLPSKGYPPLHVVDDEAVA
jgi:hypothetical protein